MSTVCDAELANFHAVLHGSITVCVVQQEGRLVHNKSKEHAGLVVRGTFYVKFSAQFGTTLQVCLFSRERRD